MVVVEGSVQWGVGGGLVGFIQKVGNHNLTHLVYNLHPNMYVNLHLQEYMEIYNPLSHV